MSKVCRPGAKNKPRHSAGGARSGAGRKPNEREHNPVPDANNERRKRKQPDTRSEADNQHKRHKKARREEDAGTSTNTDDTELTPSRAHRMGTTASSSTVEKPKKVYPMFRIRGADAASDTTTRDGTQGILDIPEMIPPISNPDILPAGTADSDDSNILPELDDSIFDGIDAERPAEDTLDPEGLVQAYLDRVQKQVTAQLDGIHKQAQCYRDGGLVDDDDKKARVLGYVETDVRDQWESLDSFVGGTYESWIKEIEALFPELEDWDKGSIEKLNRLCKQNQNISTSDLGQLRRFSKAFMVEATKLLADPAAISNGRLVTIFEGCLDQDFAALVKVMRNHVTIMGIANPAYAIPAGVPGTAGASTGVKRRTDKPPIQEVIRVAESIAAASGVDEDSDKDDFVNTGSVSKTAAAEVKGMKKELSSTMDTFAEEMAKLKDAMVVQEKRMKESLNHVETTLKHTFSQAVRGPPPHQDLPPVNPRANPNPGPLRSDKDAGCHYCWETDHRIAECDYKNEHIDMAYLSFDSGYLRLGNGAYIPRAPMDKSRKVRVDEYYASQGKPKGKPLRSSLAANYHHTQYAQTSYGEDDYGPEAVLRGYTSSASTS
ncbi:hypothetical protein C8F04DRAFT_1250312 [Mycena alexandri]|uniref:Uncharacterized protein n=1 Tax=Mycena alexandri TaxID=1745969 RepID=A0AAD6XC02_9AGAR|nr:hypothetical protein C8F04DRAFT_1250312 [Mycena alexandri]